MGANSSTGNIEKQRARHKAEPRHYAGGGHDKVRGRRQDISETKAYVSPIVVRSPDIIRTVIATSENEMSSSDTPAAQPTSVQRIAVEPTTAQPELVRHTTTAQPELVRHTTTQPHVTEVSAINEPRNDITKKHSRDRVSDNVTATTDTTPAPSTTAVEYKWSPVGEPRSRSKSEEHEEKQRVTKSTPAPRDGEYDMRTIRQAKVNVRDRISMFKDSNTPPIAVDKSRRPVTGFIKTSTSSYDHSSPPQTKRDDPIPQSKSLFEGLSKPTNENVSERPVAETALPLVPKKKHESSSRVAALPPLEANLAAELTEPEIDYNLNSPAEDQKQTEIEWRDKRGKLDDSTRMNTLEYFNNVPRESGLLKGFEKAKPAGLHKRAKPHKRAGAARARPVSMFPTTEASQYASNPDVRNRVTESTESLHQNLEMNAEENCSEKEKLGTINRHGQRYAMDDTSYETLSRKKKKIAGQQLAVGMVDKETERNFLLSLKRNLQLKQARAAGASACRDIDLSGASVDNQGEINRVNLTEMVF